MIASVTLFYEHKLFYKEYFENLEGFLTLKDFIEASIPKDMDYSKFEISFSFVPRPLLPQGRGHYLKLKDFINSEELDDIFDWANFIKKEQTKRNLSSDETSFLEVATKFYIYNRSYWDSYDFKYRYIGRYKDFGDFGINYFKEIEEDYTLLIPFFNYKSLGEKLYELYNLSQVDIFGLSRYRQSLRLPPTPKYSYYTKDYGFIGDYQDYEDFEYKNDEKKEEQFQKYIKDNQWRIDLLHLGYKGLAEKYLKDNYRGKIEELIKDTNLPWDLSELIDWYAYGVDVLDNSNKFFYEEDASEETIYVFKN